MEKFGVIMAGGGGTRFWPLSRQKTPKQLLRLDGTNYMINSAIDRMPDCIRRENIFVVTNAEQEEKMAGVTCGRISPGQILAEPCGRNTAACIGYAAMKIFRRHGDGIMVITPSDAYIKNTGRFQSVLEEAVTAAENTDQLVTVGIKPTFPATGYGYIRFDQNGEGAAKRVLEFKEKPDREQAEIFLKSGDYVWNSGMFVWKVSVILEKYRELLPDLYQQLLELAEYLDTPKERDALKRIYPGMESISIDYGVMERTDAISVIPGDFGWSDVGSWDMLGVIYPEDENGNVTVGDVLNVGSQGCVCYSEKKLLVTLGLSDVVVVNTEDAVMVCRKDNVQDIRKIVEELKRTDRAELL